MNNLEKATTLEIKNWLIASLQLNSDQKSLLTSDFLISSGYSFYKKRKYKHISFLLRLSSIPFMLFTSLLWVFLPINWIITGNWGYDPEGNLINFYETWEQKINPML